MSRRNAAKPAYVANFDSATATLCCLARFLHGKDFPMLGVIPWWGRLGMKGLAVAINALPKTAQEWIYIFSGATEALPTRRLQEADTDRIAQWLVDLYPRRSYPAIMIGSSNGALIHLCALLGIPWLPQTCLVPVRRSAIDPDDAKTELEWAREPSRLFLEINPDVQLHHLFDPNQDRLMIQRMSYFRFKRLRLGSAYERFIAQTLQPGGTLFVVDCELKWPTTRLSDRHVFQFGAVGGATVDEYFAGSASVADYLARYGSSRRRWEPPQPDGKSPEAEWGMEHALVSDIWRFAAHHGYRVQSARFGDPEDMSPFVADLYAWANRRRGIEERRLLVESFIVMEPYWTLRTGSIPFWMVFNMEPSARSLQAYLEQRAAFDDIGIMLFSHGVESAGLASIARWMGLANKARLKGSLVGVDAKAYPRDFGVFVRYSYAVRERFRERFPMPAPLSLQEFDRFIAEHHGRHAVAWH